MRFLLLLVLSGCVHIRSEESLQADRLCAENGLGKMVSWVILDTSNGPELFAQCEEE